jgi:hypothetical protein
MICFVVDFERKSRDFWQRAEGSRDQVSDCPTPRQRVWFLIGIVN